MKLSNLTTIILGVLLTASAAFADVRFFIGDARRSYWQSEVVPLGLFTTQAVSGELTLTAQRQEPDAKPVTLLRQSVTLGAGETLLWDLQPYVLRAGTYRLTAQMAGQTATLPALRLVSPVPKTHFLIGCTASPEQNAQIGGTWVGMDLYNYAKLQGQGHFVPDPLTPSGYEQGADRIISQGLRGFVWQGLWSGYVLHQPFEQRASYNDPDIVRVAMQRAELGAQQARRFLPVIASLGGMDEPGLGYGVVAEGKFKGQTMSTFPNAFQRADYERQSGAKLPNDPRTLPADNWLKWFRWRAGIHGRFFGEAVKHVKRVSPALPWGQDIYAAFAINDGTHPFNQRMNDVPTTHTFMFWRGVAEQSWNFALERTGRRDRRFHFASNTNYFGYNNPDEAALAEVVTNYSVMDGAGMLWHLNFSKAENLQPSFQRLTRFGDFILATMPDRHPFAVLYSLREAAMRLKEAGEVPNDEIYRVPLFYQQECCGLFHAIRRAGYTADIVHEEEIPEGGLKGRKVLWLAGIKHPLAKDVADGIAAFAKQGGKVFADATTTWTPPGVKVERTRIDMSTFPRRLHQAQLDGQKMWDEGKHADATRLTRQVTSDAWLDEYVLPLKSLLVKAIGKPEIERSANSIIPGKWVAGKARYYLLLNDTQNTPAEPSAEKEVNGRKVKYFPASDWTDAKGVRVTFNNLKSGEAVYVIEGKDWSGARRLQVQRGKPVTLDFEPTEMKVVCVLPDAIAPSMVEGRSAQGVVVKAELKEQAGIRTLKATALLHGNKGQPIAIPLPLRITAMNSRGEEFSYFRATDSKGIYREDFPVASNDPTGRWQVEVREMLSGKRNFGVLDVPRTPCVSPRPIPDVQVFDEAAIRALLKSKQPILVVLGDKATNEEKAVALAIDASLANHGIKAEVKEEAAVRRKGRYPKVFPSVEQRGDVWVDLTKEEREQRRKEWETLQNWAGQNGYPPSLPDAFEADDHLILVGTDKSSTLVQALQRASILPRVANDYFPGKGRGLLEFAWSPFALGKDVILVTGSDAAGVRKAAERLLMLVGGKSK